jgi:hypothetical protein
MPRVRRLSRERAACSVVAGAALALVGVEAFGCSLVESFDGYADGARADAGALDATADVGVDGRNARDADLPDVAPTLDGGSDSDGDASFNVGYCASLSPAPLFCDDFDTLDLPQNWDEVNTQGGLPARTMNDFTSPPYGLGMHVDALAAGAPLSATVVKKFPTLAGRPVHGTASFALRMTDVDTSANPAVVVWALHYEAASSFWELQVVAVSANGGRVGLLFVETGSDALTGNFYSSQTLGHTMAVSEWHRLRVVATLARLGTKPPAGVNSAKIFFDGALDATLPLTGPIVISEPHLVLGTGYVNEPSMPWGFVYDDAMIDLTSP